MTKTITPAGLSGFSDLLRKALGDRLDDAPGFLEMMAGDGVFEFPYAWEGRPTRLTGTEELVAYFLKFPDVLEIHEFSDPVVYETTDPNMTIVEFSCVGKAVATGKPYNQKYVAFIKTGDGKIQNYKDYWNPKIAIDAMSPDPV